MMVEGGELEELKVVMTYVMIDAVIVFETRDGPVELDPTV
jgi:hypothetical protein